MVKKIVKSKNSAVSQEMNMRLERIYSAFIEGEPIEGILIELEGVENEKIDDYTTWIPLRGLIMLKSYLSDGDDTIQLACRGRVAAMTNGCSNDLIESFHLMLEGDIIGIDLIAIAKESGDAEWERALYIKIIAQLVTIVEMGASRKFGYAEAVKTLESYIKDARRRW